MGLMDLIMTKLRENAVKTAMKAADRVAVPDRPALAMAVMISYMGDDVWQMATFEDPDTGWRYRAMITRDPEQISALLAMVADQRKREVI